MGIVASVEKIGPARARSLLDTQTKNRKLSVRTVAKYVATMESGHWALNGHAIVIDENGHLLDGQHRLQAVIESGVTIRSIVVQGIESGVFDTIDQGRKRSLADIAGIAGYDDQQALAAALNFLSVWLSGSVSQGGSLTADNSSLLELAGEHPDLGQSVAFLGQWQFQKGFFRRGRAIVLHYLMAQKDRAEADRFWEQMMTGEDLAGDDPVFIARKRLLEGAMAPVKRMGLEAATIMLLRAWNLRREGTTSVRPLDMRVIWSKDMKASIPEVL